MADKRPSNNGPGYTPEELATIHAAMREELSVARNDQLPLQGIKAPKVMIRQLAPAKNTRVQNAEALAAWRAGLNDGADADAESLSSLYNGQLHRLNKASHVTDGKLQENVRPSRLQRRVPAETVSARLTASLSHDSQPRKSSFDPKNLATTENFFAKPRTVQGLNSTINFQQPATLPTKVPSNFGDITEKTFKVDPSREITEAKVGVSAAAASDLNVLFNFEEVASECETNTTSIGYLGDLEGLVYEVDGISDATSPDDGSSHEATKGLASSMYAPQHTAASGLTLPTDVSNLPVSQDRTLQLGTGQYVQIRVFGSGPEISSFIAVVDQMATM